MPTPVETQKVTAYLPKATLKAAQQATGAGITETLRMALEEIARKEVYKDFLALRGTYKPGITYEEMKHDRDGLR